MDDQESLIIKLYNKGLKYKEISAEVGIPESALKSIIYRLTKAGKIKKGREREDGTSYKETTKINADGSIYSDRLIWISEQDSKDPEALLKAHGFSVGDWELIDAISNMWHMSRPKDRGRLLQFQSKIRVRPLKNNVLTLDDIDKFFENYDPKRVSKIKASKGKSGGLVLEIDLTDLHLGNPTIDIIARCELVIANILKEVAHMDIAEIILVLMGDTYHFDGTGKKTPKGTQLDGPVDFYTMFDMGEYLLLSVVNTLAEIAPVEVILIPGNHDPSSSYGLIKTLAAHYKNVDGVTVDITHKFTKHRQFGNCLVLWNHADMPKGRVMDLIYHEARKEFGETKYAEIHSGHIHHQKVFEEGGIILRYCSSITDPDDWHVLNGFIGSLRATQAFVWDKETGLKNIIFSGV